MRARIVAVISLVALCASLAANFWQHGEISNLSGRLDEGRKIQVQQMRTQWLNNGQQPRIKLPLYFGYSGSDSITLSIQDHCMGTTTKGTCWYTPRVTLIRRSNNGDISEESIGWNDFLNHRLGIQESRREIADYFGGQPDDWQPPFLPGHPWRFQTANAEKAPLWIQFGLFKELDGTVHSLSVDPRFEASQGWWYANYTFDEQFPGSTQQ